MLLKGENLPSTLDELPESWVDQLNLARPRDWLILIRHHRGKRRKAVYEKHKQELQVELLKVQNWVKQSGQKIVLMFEGRDAAGKGGTIKRFMEHLNPRAARVVALEMFFYTDTADAPWTVIKADDKKRARLNCMRHFLAQLDYPDKDEKVVNGPDPLIVGTPAQVIQKDRHLWG